MSQYDDNDDMAIAKLIELGSNIYNTAVTVDYNNKKLGYHVNEWKFSQTWTSYKATGQQHITHYHPNSVLSGIFYFSEKQDEISEYYTNLWKYMPPLIFFYPFHW